ncbi:hypothetical protein [Hirschia maritima]|uniref:hypothetical protein n=1 Tax=Hirschia maritima TaxID=1121961 RepID=UPI0003770DE3|nr:hypothetical protein [Hirschia maritima]
MQIKLSHMFIALTSVSLMACSSSPDLVSIRTISDSPVAVGSTKEIVKRAIQTSLLSRNWSILSETEDSITASIVSRGEKMAKIKVHYNTESFSIERLETAGFAYNEATNMIGPRYNRWIGNIEHDVMIRTGVAPELANAHIYRARAETEAATIKANQEAKVSK